MKLITLLALLFVLPACLSLDRHVARLGYQCGVRGPSGSEAWADLTLDQFGRRVRASWGWQWADWKREPRIRIGASAEVVGTGSLRLNDGIANVTWQHRRSDTAARSSISRLELTADPDVRTNLRGPLTSRYEQSDYHSLYLSWADLTNLARPASRLIVIIRGLDGTVLDRFEIDPAALTRAESEVSALLGELNAVAADFRGQCHPVKDIDPEIIVT